MSTTAPTLQVKTYAAQRQELSKELADARLAGGSAPNLAERDHLTRQAARINHALRG
jgi:hypothetical protein